MTRGFKDEENVKNKKAGSPIAPLGGGNAIYLIMMMNILILMILFPFSFRMPVKFTGTS